MEQGRATGMWTRDGERAWNRDMEQGRAIGMWTRDGEREWNRDMEQGHATGMWNRDGEQGRRTRTNDIAASNLHESQILNKYLMF